MARLIVVTPNPAVDVTYHVPALETGSTVRVTEVSRRPGGKGLNVVRVLQALGEAAVAVVPLGGAAGAWVASMMDVDGHAYESVAIAGETRSTVTVVDPGSHPTVFSEPGPELTPSEASQLIDATVGQCEPGCVVVVSGSLPRGTGPEWLGRLVVAVREVGARVLVDTSGPALLAAAEAEADLLKPNAAEAIEATADGGGGGSGPAELLRPDSPSGDNRLSQEGGEVGREGEPAQESGSVRGDAGPVQDGPSAEELSTAVSHLQQLGASTVVISQGADGLVAFEADGSVTKQPAVQGVTGNPTGAGDAATAGLALAWARGDGMPAALKLAAALGAAAVKQPTAGEVDLEDVRAFEKDLT